MLIPVFVSAPTALNSRQQSSYSFVLNEMAHCGLEARALGRSDYPTQLPLREVYSIARHCSGGIILGFEQFQANTGVWKQGTTKEAALTSPAVFPTPWNYLEAGILFTLKLPLLVFKEDGINGGVFDNGVTDAFVHTMPVDPLSSSEQSALRDVFLKWQGNVRQHYYSFE